MLSVPGLVEWILRAPLRTSLRGAQVLRLPFVRFARRADVALAEGGPDSDPSRRRPKDGPPDLDELWQDFNRRINGLLGGKGRGRGPGSGGQGGPGTPGGSGGTGGSLPGFRNAGIGIGVIVGVLVLIWLASGFYIVPEGQVGVIQQFGRYKQTTGAGFNWRLPSPIQSHEVVNVESVRKVEIGFRQSVKTKVARESLMLTEDENIIDIQAAVQYRIKDASEFVFNNRNAEDSVMQAAETALREVVGKNKMDFVLYSGREQVAAMSQQLVQRILDRYKAGIVIANVTILNAQPPEKVQPAFNDAVRARQDQERQRSEGEAYANDVVPKARGTASRLLEEANGYRQRVVAQAEGDASRFRQVLSAYSKAPGVTRDRMYLETMQQIFSNTTKVLVDSRSNNNLLYLPLDKLLQANAPAAAAAVRPPGAPAAPGAAPGQVPAGNAPGASAADSSASQNVPPQVDVDSRSRDALRNRDRESR